MGRADQRLLATTALGLCLAAALAPAAWSQTAPATQEVGELVVTGTRIPTPNLTSISPVTVVDSKEIKFEGATRAEDLINNLPQVFGQYGGNIDEGATGTATLNLRGLGAQRTLVLVDGRRLMPGDPGRTDAGAADLNFVPATLVRRVEVLTGGASAVYGSDAVAGVVNFIIDSNFQGVRIDGQYSGYSHASHDNSIEAVVRASGIALPPSHVWDGGTSDITVTVGANAPDGNGNLVAYVGHRRLDPMVQSTRDFSACPLGEAGAAFTCSGSIITSPAVFLANGGGFGPPLTLNGSGGLRPYNGATDAFNFSNYDYFQRADERWTSGAFAHYQVNRSLDVYLQAMFMDDHTIMQQAPSGNFFARRLINCDNPFLSAAEVAGFCTRFGYTGSQMAPLLIAKRNVEGVGRVDDLRHTDYRIVLGARGELGKGWKYDIYGQYGTALYSEEFIHDLSAMRVQRALDVVNVAGTPTCASAVDGSDPACVPYNIFQVGGVTPAAVRYLETQAFKHGSTAEEIVDGSLSGQLGVYGIKSPWAKEGVGVAVGAEYRRESSDLRTDNEFSSGDLTGQPPTLPVAGAFSLWEVFGEARVPVVQDRPFFNLLQLEGGARYSRYSGFSTWTYKAGAEWAPVEDVRLRASYQRAVRAPNIVELFQAQNLRLDGNTDPCAGATPSAANPAATAANCAFTGVTAAQYGTILANPAAEYNGLVGGNSVLKPEQADTYDVGLVLTPSFLPRASLTLDWFDIKVTNVIGVVGADLTLNQCLTTHNPFFCDLIHRSAIGSLWLGRDGYVVDLNQNVGSTETSGVDLEANYRFDLKDLGVGDHGGIAINFVGTWLDKFLTEPLPGLGKYDCVGLYGTVCGTPKPDWRHKLRVTWTTPWNVEASLAWRYIASVGVDSASSSPFLHGNVDPVDAKLGARGYFDLTANWQVTKDVTLRAGINNLFDKDPPLIGLTHLPSVFGSGNTFPQVYDTLGRYVFVGMTATL